MPTKQKVTNCMVVGDSIVRNVGTEHADVNVECFPGIKTEQIRRVMEKKVLVSPETVIIHVGTNALRTRNLDFVMRDVSWQRFEALNDRFRLGSQRHGT
jgi:hypothetical protein